MILRRRPMRPIFQSTLPQGERRRYNKINQQHDDFNPRSRKGSDSVVAIFISVKTLFQSTLPQGERPCVTLQSAGPLKYFNPRSRKGSDCKYSRVPDVALISIHAPARGATIFAVRRFILSSFQSTLPQGERQVRKPEEPAKELFQSTLPQGERPNLIQIHFLQTGFQSTLPQGERRYILSYKIRDGSISIHAPARGATSRFAKYYDGIRISIHAPARGATNSNQLHH